MSLSPELRAQFLELIDRHFGIRQSEYGIGRIQEAIERVLPRTPCQTAQELLGVLSRGKHADWLDSIVEHLTVGETYFFRDPAQLAALREVILPALIETRASERRLRIWSAGCSTGEEPYTFALLLREMPALDDWQLSLHGTDVNRASLRVAREARYVAWSFRATPDDLRSRFFEPVGNRWQMVDSIRSMVRFGWTNLAADPLVPPAVDLDLIACRNVTIYFDDAATQRLYRALIASLAPGGWLMLGPSDPLPAERDLLERFEVRNAVLWRRRAAPVAVRAVTPAPRVAKPVLPRPKIQKQEGVPASAKAELEAGLLALEAGSAGTALEWLRRATFREPHSPLAQFALGRAYLGAGDAPRAVAALLHAQRLLTTLDDQAHVPGSDDMSVETLRQAVQTHLSALEADGKAA
jgi:chemotaxis protein methyltransferase CheR